MRDQSTPASNTVNIDLAFIDEDELSFNKLEEFFRKVAQPSSLINQALLHSNTNIRIFHSLIRKILTECNTALIETTCTIANSHYIIQKLAMNYPSLHEQTDSELLDKLTTIFQHEEAKVRACEAYGIFTKAFHSTAETILKLLDSLLKRMEAEGDEFAKKSVAFLFLTNRLVDEQWVELRKEYVRVRIAAAKVERLLVKGEVTAST